MEDAAGIDELRELVGRLSGCAVRAVQVQPHGEGRFGLQLSARDRLGWLWIHSEAWRLDGREAVLAAAGDDTGRLAVDLSTLVDRVISSVDVRLPGRDTRIRFEDEVLTIYSVHHRDTSALPDWTFRLPSGRLLQVGPGPRWAVVE
ncbi:hypothetical protein ACIQ9P_32075 [Kitasatospora sp. NPDC094019]|uniref:hypothetical protein n=1 Tax=Kitasatospora sp. NPDC094019 TaxID=3364091 RepID=UPI00381A047F